MFLKRAGRNQTSHDSNLRRQVPSFRVFLPKLDLARTASQGGLPFHFTKQRGRNEVTLLGIKSTYYNDGLGLLPSARPATLHQLY